MQFLPSSLRFRLMLLVVMSILPIFGLMVHYAAQERNRELREIQDEAVRMAQLSAGSISQVTEGTRQMLLALAYTEPVRTMNGPEASRLFAELLKQSKPYMNLGLVRDDGLIIASGLPLSKSIYVNDRAWFQHVRQARDFSISEYLVGRITNKPSINLGFPVPGGPDHASPGAVFATLDLRTLQDCIARPHLPTDAVILALDRKGTYVARHPRPQLVGKLSHSWMALQAAGGHMDRPVSTVGIDGVPRIYHYVPVPGTDGNLFVAVGISKTATMKGIMAGFRRNLYILICWTAASLAGAWVIGNASVLRHVNRLTEAARRLADRDWNASAKISGGSRELQQLSLTFDAMARVLREQNEHLEKQVQERTAELTTANESLKEALAQVKTLNRLLPICSGCKKIRDDKGYWSQIESYITAHSDARFSHGLCPDCTRKYFPELNLNSLDIPEP